MCGASHFGTGDRQDADQKTLKAVRGDGGEQTTRERE